MRLSFKPSIFQILQVALTSILLLGGLVCAATQPNSSTFIKQTGPASLEPIVIPELRWLVKDVQRTVDLTRPTTKVLSLFKVQNNDPDPQTQFYHLIENRFASKLAWLEAREKKSSAQRYAVTRFGREKDSAHDVYLVTLPKPIAAGEETTIFIETIYIHAFEKSPLKVAQDETQAFLYTQNQYVTSSYLIEKQKTKIRCPSNIIGYTKGPDTEATRSGPTMTFGPYSNVQAFSLRDVDLRYEFPEAIVELEHVRRTIDVSHLSGHINVEEDISLKHGGSELKGHFSRVRHQVELFHGVPSNALKDVTVRLPASASAIRFYDTIGNVSTSEVTRSIDQKLVKLRPRYPLLGGWRYEFTFTYRLPLSTLIRGPSSKHVLSIPFAQKIGDAVIEHLECRIVLPVGASIIGWTLPFEVQTQTVEHSKGWLDVQGRPTLVLTKDNVVEPHHEALLVEYSLSRIQTWQKAGLATLAFFCIFLIASVSSRFQIALEDSNPSSKKQKRL